MLKSIYIPTFLFFAIQISLAQNNLLWKGYFSYTEIKDMSASSNTLYAASENAIFSIAANSNQIKTTNTIDGLSGQVISTIYQSELANKTLIGYENGLLAVIDQDNQKIINLKDIINKSLVTRSKKINHFYEYEGIVYISCDFGIVQFNLKTLLFGDTYFIGANGAEIEVSQTTVFNGFIYAATNFGIRRALITNKNLNDFAQWEQVASGSWSGIEAFGTELIATDTSGNMTKYNTNAFSFFSNLGEPILNIKSSAAYLIVTTTSSVLVYNPQLVLVQHIINSEISDNNPSFSGAYILADDLFIGTKQEGLFKTKIGSKIYENVTPSGPSRNNIVALQTNPNLLWACYGDYDTDYNPYPLDNYGISKYSDSGWLNIPYKEVLNAKSISRITINPNNEKEVYASSFFSGLLKIVNDKPEILYNQSNSGLETLTFAGPNYFDVRINGAAFDRLGGLWVTNSLVENGLKVLKANGDWQSFSMKTIISTANGANFSRLVIDSNGTKWMGTERDGVIGFNEKNNGVFKKMTLGPNLGNLPSADVRTLAVDTRNQLWIGTNRGLRVLSSVSSYQTESQLKANPIIILEDNLPQELLNGLFITDIVVDGANNKWIGTADSGVFFISPNGQETKFHFTIDNSPLPSNSINDIDINSATGEVFIATDKGLISFRGIATAAKEDLTQAYVYPNPVRPEYQGTVKIAGLINKANVKITDIEGNLVFETTAEGGTIEWDTTAFGKYKVASGVYLIFISAKDGVETKVKKVMIIR